MNNEKLKSYVEDRIQYISEDFYVPLVEKVPEELECFAKECMKKVFIQYFTYVTISQLCFSIIFSKKISQMISVSTIFSQYQTIVLLFSLAEASYFRKKCTK